jgi:hypothetical protein
MSVQRVCYFVQAPASHVDTATDTVNTPDESIVPANPFCLLVLLPNKVDHLFLKGQPQRRYVYTTDSSSSFNNSSNEANVCESSSDNSSSTAVPQWTCQRVNP